ncbi:MAG: histidine kinase [Bacteroidota bacterium]
MKTIKFELLILSTWFLLYLLIITDRFYLNLFQEQASGMDVLRPDKDTVFTLILLRPLFFYLAAILLLRIALKGLVDQRYQKVNIAGLITVTLLSLTGSLVNYHLQVLVNAKLQLSQTFQNNLISQGLFATGTVLVIVAYAYGKLKFTALLVQLNKYDIRIAWLTKITISWAAFTGLVYLTGLAQNSATWPFCLITLPVSLLHGYILIFWLIPRYEGNKTSLHLTLLILATLILACIHTLALQPALAEWLSLWQLLILTCAAHLLVVLPLSWYIHFSRVASREHIAELQQALVLSRSKLDQLVAQVNPHFLFNSLNTLYGLAILENAEQTTSGIQKLGDLMRVALRTNLRNKVALSKEIDYLNNYIDFQMLRHGQNKKFGIHVDLKAPTDELYIVPMLLMPFIENAFKHGISTVSASTIDIRLIYQPQQIELVVTNSKPSKIAPQATSQRIGLTNVKAQLQLLYPGNYQLEIIDQKESFTVNLKLAI